MTDRRSVLIDAIKNMAKIRALHARKLELYDEMDHALAHEVMKMDKIVFADREYRTLKKAYDAALKEGKKGDDVIEVEIKGAKHEFVMMYAYYVLQHLMNQGFGSHFDVLRKPK